MFPLQGPQMLQMLEKSLRKSLPESLKEMRDDLDNFTNTYQIYSKEPRSCHEFLGASDVINWKQHLQIQSSQSSLEEVIQSLAAVNFTRVKKAQHLLYMTSKTAQRLLPFLLATRNLCPNSGRPKAINQEMFKLSSLDDSHAVLVDQFWGFGGSEKSQRFIKRCIQTFPSTCVVGPEGSPVSWALMDQTGEIRMGGTVPKYRAQGLSSYVFYVLSQALEKLDFPAYNNTGKSNKFVQRMSETLHHLPLPCDWNQWTCEPL
ncbi:glycine N-acyltransferase-like isoform X2 [Perognathus longimembris pacificus]|uniref:glycine N-acyltransferase-like isoform X2 n=1 Tax=Perognathus longimembris pacificus TaxID=214514 RepID=UPI00201853C4|nr:glycine N-acyltransferase-like isoform X2 [Perognathus longimembris pacificus]XP_048217516.1 glycine N-acyltransferase-like isoform X2 [Perognathus longimembris pacificus]XP_048217518.1 glycine N-acyltransferase-like isoform X2 [Perognathus longimembris pacificus]XP_048217519.1 glycine N-acyltransferase-like isoform X2 [Perognathus longimembris pacificus]